MKIKQFEFESFDEWRANKPYEYWDSYDRWRSGNSKEKYETSLGDYNLHIKAITWGAKGTEYSIAISTDSNPHGQWQTPIYQSSFWHKNGNDEEFRQWYETAVINANIEFEKYLLKTYFA